MDDASEERSHGYDYDESDVASESDDVLPVVAPDMLHNFYADIWQTADASESSDSTMVNLLLMFQTRVDTLYVNGAFDGETDNYGRPLHETVSTMIDAHIAEERKKMSERTRAYVSKSEPVPNELIDFDDVPELDADTREMLERIKDELAVSHVMVASAHMAATERVLEVIMSKKGNMEAVEDPEFLKRIVMLYGETASPAHAAVVRMLEALSATLETFHSKSRKSAPGGSPSRELLDSTTTSNRKQRVEPESSSADDWRCLFPESITGMIVGDEASDDEEAQNQASVPAARDPVVPKTYDQRQRRLNTLKETYGSADWAQVLQLDGNSLGQAFTDIPAPTRNTFKAELVPVRRYVEHYARGHKALAGLKVASYLIGIVLGGGASIGLMALSELFIVVTNWSEAEGGPFSPEFKAMLKKCYNTYSTAKTAVGFLAALGIGGGVAGLKVPIVWDVFAEIRLIWSFWMKTPWVENGGLLSGPGFDPFRAFMSKPRLRIGKDEVISYVQQARTTTYNGYGLTEVKRATQLALNDPMAEFAKHGFLGELVRPVVDLLFQIGQKIPLPVAWIAMITKDVYKLYTLHRDQVRPDRARIWLYENDPEDPAVGGSKALREDMKTMFFAAKKMLGEGDEYLRGLQVAPDSWFAAPAQGHPNYVLLGTLPAWYETPAAHAATIVARPDPLKRRHEWVSKQKEMFEKADKQWTSVFDGKRNWAKANLAKLIEYATRVKDAKNVIKYIDNTGVLGGNAPTPAGTPQLDLQMKQPGVPPANGGPAQPGSVLVQLRILQTKYDTWENLHELFQREFNTQVGRNSRATPHWGDDNIPASEVSKWWFMLARVMHYQWVRLHGKEYFDVNGTTQLNPRRRNQAFMAPATLENEIRNMDTVIYLMAEQIADIDPVINTRATRDKMIKKIKAAKKESVPLPMQGRNGLARRRQLALVFNQLHPADNPNGAADAAAPAAAVPLGPLVAGGVGGGGGPAAGASVVDEVFARLHRLCLS